MTVCPHCGTAYAVLPQTCAVCGEQLTDPGFTDPFAAAVMQEAQTASQKEKEKKNQKKKKPEPKSKETQHAKAEKKPAAKQNTPAKQTKSQKSSTKQVKRAVPGAERSDNRARLRMTAAIIGILALTAVVIWQLRQDYLENSESESSIAGLHDDPAAHPQLDLQEDTDYEAYSD